MEPMPPASAPSQPAVLTSVMARTTRTAKAAAASWSRLGQIRHERTRAGGSVTPRRTVPVIGSSRTRSCAALSRSASPSPGCRHRCSEAVPPVLGRACSLRPGAARRPAHAPGRRTVDASPAHCPGCRLVGSSDTHWFRYRGHQPLRPELGRSPHSASCSCPRPCGPWRLGTADRYLCPFPRSSRVLPQVLASGLGWPPRQRPRRLCSGSAVDPGGLMAWVRCRLRSRRCAGQCHGWELEASRWPRRRCQWSTGQVRRPRPAARRADANLVCWSPKERHDGPGSLPATRPARPPGRPAQPSLELRPSPPTARPPRRTQLAPGPGEGHRQGAVRPGRRPAPADPGRE